MPNIIIDATKNFFQYFLLAIKTNAINVGNTSTIPLFLQKLTSNPVIISFSTNLLVTGLLRIITASMTSSTFITKSPKNAIKSVSFCKVGASKDQYGSNPTKNVKEYTAILFNLNWDSFFMQYE